VFLHSYRRRWRTDQLAALVFALFTIIFVTGVSNTLSTFENNRYRFPLDGFYITLLGLMLTHAAAARELRGEARFAGAPASAGRC
jgi:hypothetical protein